MGTAFLEAEQDNRDMFFIEITPEMEYHEGAGYYFRFDGNFEKDWGDGTSDSQRSHWYSNLGSYIVKSNGLIEGDSYGYPPFTKKAVRAAIFHNPNLGELAFLECENLTKVVLCGIEQTIPNAAFQDSGLTDFEFVESITSIGYSAFVNCNLSRVTIPKGVVTIGDGAFGHNTNLTRVSFESGSALETIGSMAFAGGKFTTISIPQSVRAIGHQAFVDCVNLTDVNIPYGVTRLSGTFINCSSLPSLTLPSTITRLEGYIFDGTTALRNIYFDRTMDDWYNATAPYGGSSIGRLTNCTVHCIDGDIYYGS